MYGAFLHVKDRNCVIVGGGSVAERKAAGLLECGAKITVIAPRLSSRLQILAEQGTITHIPRSYRRGDVCEAFLVIAATNSPQVNMEVADEADAYQRLVNVVNVPERCSFFVPSVVRRGSLALAISTSGMSPAVAKQIREELERQFGPEYEVFLQKMGEIRRQLKTSIENEEARREVFRQIARSDVLLLIRQGQMEAADRRIAELMRRTNGR